MIYFIFSQREFGHLHSKAIDETWYKSAVIQRQYDIESFVYSVPFQSSFGEDVFVTGSYAIFPSDASSEAPGSVVGFQFSYSKLKARVKKLSSVVSVSLFSLTFVRFLVYLTKMWTHEYFANRKNYFRISAQRVRLAIRR